jgi:hypothetical protein
MDLLDQMLAEAEADFDVSEQEELERTMAEAVPLSARGAPSHVSQVGPGSSSELAGRVPGATKAPEAVPSFMVVGATAAGWQGQNEPPPAAADAAPPEEHGPPPPPEGAEDAPRPDWGPCHLCVVSASSAAAKFGGGGAVDVPTATSKVMGKSRIEGASCSEQAAP